MKMPLFLLPILPSYPLCPLLNFKFWYISSLHVLEQIFNFLARNYPVSANATKTLYSNLSCVNPAGADFTTKPPSQPVRLEASIVT